MLFKKQRRRASSSASTKLSFEILESRQLLAGLDGSEVIGLPSDMISNAYVFIGDHSGSNSEKWNMAVGDRTHSAPDFGVVQRDYRQFKKGESYPVGVQHAGSIYPTGEEDFDYRAWVDRYANPTWESGNPIPSGHEFFATDAQQLFQRQYWANTGDADPTLGKSAAIHFPALDLDIDSDSNGTLARTVAEDVAETDQTKGLFFQVHSGDVDGDGTLDNFDFNGIAGLSFTSIALSLSANVAHANAAQITLTFSYDDASMTSGDTGLFRVWTKDATQARTASDFIESGESTAASSIGLTPGSTITLYLEGVNSTRRTVNFDPISVTANIAGSAIWNGALTDKIHASGVDVDLDAKTVNHNAANGDLEDTNEQSVGAFLPINNDDDDYDTNNRADLRQTGAIQGEDDLLPIVVRKIARGGIFRVTIPSHLKVWKNADRTIQVTATTDIDASVETTLFVEGISKGTGDLKLHWKLGEQKIINGDQVKATSFEWSGPLNVPGYSIYNYKAEGALGTSKWVTPSDGTIKTGANTSDVTILWGQGAVVGKAIYQVNDKYTWDLKVNVVRVRLGTLNQITYQNDPINVPGTLLIKSADPGPAMKAELNVEIEGPLVGGNMRGVKFIETGFTQTILPTSWHADYDQLPKVGQPGFGRRLTSNMQGTEYLDTIRGSALPWYDTQDQGFPGANGLEKNLADQLTQATLGTGDTPSLPGTSHYQWNENGVIDEVDLFSLVFDFEVCLTVRTIERSNDAEKVFTKRARADWQFDGTGTIAVIGNGTWTFTGNGNTGDNSFTEVTDGSRLTDERRVFNTVLDNNLSWSMANQ